VNDAFKGRHTVALFSSMVFVLAISLPFATQVLKLEPQRKAAEKQSQPLPEFAPEWKTLRLMGHTLADGWLDKNFAFRGELIRWYNYTSAKIFGSLSTNSPVLVGKEGWLFLAKDRNRDVMEEHRAVKPYTEGQLAKLAALYEERRDWLAKRGISYRVAVAPNKDTVYPEFLPDAFQQVGRQSRLDQIFEYLRAHSTVEFLDLRQPLLEAKKGQQVFFSTDSHWNVLGAFPCYQAIIASLSKAFPAVRPMRFSDFTLESYSFLGGDLSYLLGMEDLITEDKLYLMPKRPLRGRGISTGYFAPGYIQPAQGSTVDDPALPKAVFFHDSYFWEILPFIGEHFSRAVYVWVKPGSAEAPQIFDKELIEAEKPQIVIEEIAERFFIPIPEAQGPEASSHTIGAQ